MRWLVVMGFVLWAIGRLSASPLWFETSIQSQAAGELARQLHFVASAELSPQFSQLSEQLAAPNLSAEQRSELLTEAYLLLRSFNQHLALRVLTEVPLLDEHVALESQEGSVLQLAHALQERRIIQEVMALEPQGVNYLSARHWVEYLQSLAHVQWPDFHGRALLEPGDRHDEIEQVRLVLKLLKDYDGPWLGRRYDDELVQAVTAFQRRHGLEPDGVIGPKTRHWLAKTPQLRAQLLSRNILRQSADKARFADEHWLVNIPEFRLRWNTAEGVKFESKVVVGRSSRRTPRMVSEVASIVVNPSWNVPRSIIRKDIVRRIRKDGDYLSAQQFDVYDWQGKPVILTASEWQQKASGRFPYRLTQRPGEINALGRYKFHLNDSGAIYLHDTPTKALFNEVSRGFSSGCVRVQDADILAYQLAQSHGVNNKLFNRALRSQSTQWLKLASPMPVYMVYWSAWMGVDHRPQYRPDIYSLERDLDHEIGIAQISAPSNKSATIP
ncbi:L,D-transpeptidase family protein [Ferrimonas aestuarii]|uniref:L,D-TPase catalytic domain-containing protein n=1 Tax=Ferrimonas aestuarii TaxID=2569539 RepID=A0A4V5NW23_9GAMM|nr:L,D-transpeptidase family protein [Ferrimonas aestuarii]TKB54512.1 hypothetical protein FCL42_11920 [Ferrimonas aestuarii]